jgi:hypothetical protein
VVAHVPLVTDTALYVVTDTLVCQSAVSAYNTAADVAGNPATAVYVIHAGPVYIVSNPALPSGEFVPQFVFDSTFTLLSSYLR